jgi:hypothetical protein
MALGGLRRGGHPLGEAGVRREDLEMVSVAAEDVVVLAPVGQVPGEPIASITHRFSVLESPRAADAPAAERPRPRTDSEGYWA